MQSANTFLILLTQNEGKGQVGIACWINWGKKRGKPPGKENCSRNVNWPMKQLKFPHNHF